MLHTPFDTSDADVTGEIPGAVDRTAVDLAPLSPDVTSEISALDILEVTALAGASASVTTDVTGSPVPTEIARVPAATTRTPTMSSTALRAAQPSSLAPLSLDVMAPRVPGAAHHTRDAGAAWLPTSSAMIDFTAAAGLPRTRSRVIAYVSAVAAACLVAGTVGAVLGYAGSRTATASAPSSPTVFQAPRLPTVLEATEEVTQGPGSALQKSAPEAGEPPTSHAASGGAHAAPAHPATGILRVPSGTTGALVDGAPQRVEGSSLVVACGHRRVKLPGRSVRNVDVPCGGTGTF
ncbi:MAG: hypothetical protein JWP97_1490 [Labilithrix sp.]|nr:hypothetical protein [Labilithrix sp.]